MASLHHLVCWNPDYVEQAVEKHLSVIHGPAYGADSDGGVWWGKFRVPLDEDGNPGEEYEPYGESKSGEDAAREVEGFKERIRAGQEVRLYIHNPNPPMTECHVARVVDMHYGESATLPKDSQGRPACARIPDYYFHRKASDRCQGCRALDPHCRLKHECGYWYKLDAIKPNPHGELYGGLLDAKTGSKLNFAVTLLYPLLVQEQEERASLFGVKSGTARAVSEPNTPWQESFPVIERAEQIRDLAINQFIKGSFEKADDLAKAEFFLNRYLLDDAAMYLAHRYEKVLNYLERLNGDVERSGSNWTFIQRLTNQGRISKEQSVILGAANGVRNAVYHGGKPPSQRNLLDLLRGLRDLPWR